MGLKVKMPKMLSNHNIHTDLVKSDYKAAAGLLKNASHKLYISAPLAFNHAPKILLAVRSKRSHVTNHLTNRSRKTQKR